MTDTAGKTIATVAVGVLILLVGSGIIGTVWTYNQTTLNATIIAVHNKDITDMKIKQEGQVAILTELAKCQARSEILLQQLVEAHKQEALKGP